MRTDERRMSHDVMLYDDEFDLASAAASFVHDGIEAGEVVLVNTSRHPVTPLLRAMFDGEEQVVVADRSVYSTPAATLDGYRRTMARGLAAGVTGYRAIGWIDFDTSYLPWQEWVRYEAAVNRVFAGFPFRTMCPFDTGKVAAEVVDPVMRSHTGIYTADEWRPNPDYVDPEVLVGEGGVLTPPHPLQSTPPRMVLEPDRDLMEVRMEIYAATMFTALPRGTVDDFVKAVSEVVTNAYKHGGDPVRLRLWASDDALVCTVTDQGPGIADPLAGYARPAAPSQGLGLWAARQLVDVLDFRPTDDGFTVRLTTYR